MNHSADTPVPPTAATPVIRFEEYVRQNPGGMLLVAAGLGLAAVLVARALTPAPPRNRAVQLLEDIQSRLASLAEDGAHAVSKGVDNLGALHLDRRFDGFTRGFKSLFH